MNVTPVFLRNGEAAKVLGRVAVRPFALVGRRGGGTGELELWQESGAWREDGAEHPLDIVSLVLADGQIVQLKAGAEG